VPVRLTLCGLSGSEPTVICKVALSVDVVIGLNVTAIVHDELPERFGEHVPAVIVKSPAFVPRPYEKSKSRAARLLQRHRREVVGKCLQYVRAAREARGRQGWFGESRIGRARLPWFKSGKTRNIPTPKILSARALCLFW
jgi:hypothetical protein